jgi:hypothetical protein
MLCVEIAPNTYRHNWHHFKPDGFGIGMQGTEGVIREITIEKFEPLGLLSYGLQFYSSDANDEVGLIRVNRHYWQNAVSAADNCIMYSMGPNIGSGGLLGFEHGGGLFYGGNKALHVWATKPIIAQSWAANVVTHQTEEPHGVQVGNTYVVVGSVGTGGGAAGYSGTFTAITGTSDKTLKGQLLVDPGASTTLGTFGPATLTGGVYSQTPRSIRVQNLTRRGGTNTSFKFDAGADVSFIDCKSDDPGTPFTGTTATWSGGTATYAFSEDTGIRVGDYFFASGYTPAGYDGTLLAIAGTTGTTVLATIASPGGSGTIMGTVKCCANGVYLGPNVQGPFKWQGGQFHEHGGNAVRHLATLASPVTFQDTIIYNASEADKAGVWSGYYQASGCSNVLLSNVSSGTGDSWRGASRTITFTGQPSAAETITFNGTAVTFRATATLPNEVTIGATTADTVGNLIEFINTTNYSPFIEVAATLDTTGLIITLRHYPGPVGNSYTLTEAATNVAVSGSPLSGSSGTLYQKYGFEGIVNGLRNCTILNCNGNNNISGAFSETQPDFVLTDSVDTLTNKTLTTPAITSTTWANIGSAATANKLQYVSDVGSSGSLWRSTGTRWKPVNGLAVLATLDTGLSGVANTETIAFQYLLPINALQTFDRLRFNLSLSKTGVTDSLALKVRVGTAGTTADTQVLSVSALSATARSGSMMFDFRLASATSLQQLGSSGGASITSGYSNNTSVANVAAVAITSAAANALYVTVTIASTSTNDTVGLLDAQLMLLATAN